MAWRSDAPRKFDLCAARDAATGAAAICVVAGLSIRIRCGGAKAIAVLAAVNRMNVRIASYHSSALRLQWAVQWLRIAPRSTVVVAATHGLLGYGEQVDCPELSKAELFVPFFCSESVS